MIGRCCWALAGLLLAVAGAAHAQLDLDRLQRLVEQGRVERAYQLAEEHRAELEGRTRFDFYYGVAAIQTGHVAEGVFALERVLMRRPGLDRARLELARGYFLLGEDRRAREEFRSVMGGRPPESIKATIDRYLEAIRRRSHRYETVTTAYVELVGGWDSNVNSATDADSVDLPSDFLRLTLDEDRQEQGDAFGRMAAGARVRRPLTPHQGVFGGIDVQGRHYAEENDFNRGKAAGRVGWRWSGDAARLRLTVRGSRFFVDREAYRDRIGAGADLRYAFTEPTAATAFAGMDWLDHPDQPIRDARLWTAGLGLDHLFRGPYRPAVSLQAFGGREMADKDSDAARAIAERDLYGARLDLRFVVHPRWRVELGGRVRRSDYAAEHPLFQETRRETYHQADLSLTWQLTRHWRIGPQVRYSANEADLAIYDYERTQAWLRLRYDHF